MELALKLPTLVRCVAAVERLDLHAEVHFG